MSKPPWSTEAEWQPDPEYDFVYPPEAKLFEQYAESAWWSRSARA